MEWDPTVGHEQQKHRPCIAISAQLGALVIVVPLTSSRPKVGSHVEVETRDRVSTALCEQVRSVDVQRITKRDGAVEPDRLRAVRDVVALLIGV
ncbi:type II toxin-antitoxin system PemK/MazF family toxin [Agromyces archimandritae]|uniref:Type II toxin-antitoxin system PemK/MazF family toxin n=1 Tax=Agromyces archimandritae TaxID=2781962 RepID=A0A975FNQ6_9MICO|nr:type II toxin-antitoxin system PemK/MazF family toxin [Agromyces archimandritae]QTX05790.1 type II toxin-antitoxin system PemK/MazF family toxin [Agromyces archimandritae]